MTTQKKRASRVPWCVLLGAVAMLGSRELRAQCNSVSASSGSSVTANLCMRVQDVMVMTVSGGLTGVSGLTRTQFTASATPAGSSTYIPFGGSLTFAVASNREFALTVQGAFGTTGKAASDVLWSIVSGNFTNVAQSVGAPLASNRTIPFPARIANGAVSRTVFFASRWVFENDKPGSYPLTLTFTLAPK